MVLKRKQLTTAAKILLSGVLLYFVFTKIEPETALRLLGQAEILPVVLAITCFILSKVMAAFRLNFYFRAIRVGLSEGSNLRLYLLGMFYNLFLPGGIGGDAYKGYLIRKRFGTSLKKVVAALLLDRLSGLLLLFMYACALTLWIDEPVVVKFRWLLLLAGVLAPLVFLAVQKRFFRHLATVFWQTFMLSALVQFMQLLCVVCVLWSLGVSAGSWSYLFIFLISSIVAVLPLTIGGIGSREVVFYYGAQWLGLTEQVSVSISLMFFLITALVSLFGMMYHFRKPTLQAATPEDHGK